MTRPQPGCFLPLLLLGTIQSALGASILVSLEWAWGLVAAAYFLWLKVLIRQRHITSIRLVAWGYIAPVSFFGCVYAGSSIAARPETSEAIKLLRTKTMSSPAEGTSDIPAPKLVTTHANQAVTRGVWLLFSTFFYLAGCGVAGLFMHTPVVLYLVTAVVATFTVRLPKELT